MGHLTDLPLFKAAAKDEEPLSPQIERPKTYSVAEITTQIKKSLENDFGDIWIKGEISNFRPAASGHVYFSLKDSKANLSAVIFGWGRRKQKFQAKDGLQVLCHGKISVYPPRGTYQIVVDEIQPLGAGALQVEFERLKSNLHAEGLFEQSRKKALPLYPKKVVFITSPTGAAIQDILNVLGRRAPQVQILICPVLVQGDGAGKEISESIDWVNRLSDVDLIVVTRGGGSIEDLWAFNEERVARSISHSRVPVISAVGHEIDFTISDFVSDLRAPTPSAAAEILSSRWVESTQTIRNCYGRLVSFIRSEISQQANILTHLSARVKSPKDRLRERAQRCDELMLRLDQGMSQYLLRRRDALKAKAAQLNALSPLNILERGFAIVHDHEKPQNVIKSIKQVRSKQKLQIRFQDGQVSVESL